MHHVSRKDKFYGVLLAIAIGFTYAVFLFY